MYGKNWYGYASQKLEYDSQISCSSSCYYMLEKVGPNNFSGDFCYNGLLLEGFGYGGDYQISIGSQGSPKVSPLLNELSLQRYAIGNGHFQGFNSSHETVAYDLRQLNNILFTIFYLQWLFMCHDASWIYVLRHFLCNI